MSAYNIKDGTSGPSFSWTTEIAAELSYLSNCQEHEDGYSFIKIRNDKKLYKAFSFDKEDGKTFLTAQDDALKLIVKGTDIGPYNVEELNIKIDDLNFGANGYAINCENSTQGCGIEEAFVSHYEETNDGWIRITFSGEAWMQTITPAAAGNFPIEGIILCKAN